MAFEVSLPPLPTFEERNFGTFWICYKMIANAVQCHSLTFMSLQNSFTSGYEFLNLSRIVILVWQKILLNRFIAFIVHDKRCYMIWKDQWITYWASIFPCCVLSYILLVFVVEHSRRWWLHIGGSKMLAPHFKDEIAGLQKWPFLAGFDLFCCSFCYCDLYLWENHVYLK